MSTDRTRILVVDDERNIRITLSDILKAEGYVVSTAESGERAVKLCLAREFDFVLMDVRMPGIDGVEAFRRIRRERPASRFVMMSAYALEGMRKVALDEGAIAFLRKPLRIEDVIELVRSSKMADALLVEQDDACAGPLAQTLREMGYRVRVAESPHHALELARRRRFELVFLATNQSLRSGLELQRAMHDLSRASAIVMIADNEATSQRIAEQATGEHADAVLQKPVTVENVVALVTELDRLRNE